MVQNSEDIETQEVSVTFTVTHGQTEITEVSASHGDDDKEEAYVCGSIYYQLQELGINPRSHGLYLADE